jgi:hypothetical protein
MSARLSLTAEHLRAWLHYDPVLGFFMWLAAPQTGGKVKPGDVAGRIDSKGYVRIGLARHQYRAHRLAWLYMTGTWPAEEIDHVDRCRSNNHWLNLRLATTGQNKQNISLRNDNVSGVTGVYWSATRRCWVAQITQAGRRRTLGSYATAQEATQRRRDEEQAIFTHATRH